MDDFVSLFYTKETRFSDFDFFYKSEKIYKCLSNMLRPSYDCTVLLKGKVERLKIRKLSRVNQGRDNRNFSGSI